MSESVNPQKLSSRGGPITHLPLAFGQLFHLMLLGFQGLLHLSAEGQVPEVTLERREVSAPILQNLRPNWAGLALPILHQAWGTGSRMSQQGGVSGQFPWLRPRLWQQGN